MSIYLRKRMIGREPSNDEKGHCWDYWRLIGSGLRGGFQTGLNLDPYERGGGACL
jgi:hypothetical protein